MAEPLEPSRPLLSLVIPACNEVENVEPLIRELAAALPELPGACEVIFVDDGSRDGTWAALRRAAGDLPWLRGIRFLGNQGQTAAMAAGIEAARGELIAFLDADLQNDPRDLARLVRPILDDQADVVCGWRAQRRDRRIERVLPSRLANGLISRSLGLRLHDIGCTLKVFRRVYLEDVGLFGEMHRFIPAFAQAQGARILELEVGHRTRRAGRSHYGLSRTYKVLVDLLTVWMLSGYGTKPAYFFAKIAFVLGGLGTGAFSVVAYRALWLDRPQSTPLIFVMLLLYTAALISLMSGLLAEINVRVLHQVGGRRQYRIVERLEPAATGGGSADPAAAGSG